MKELIHLIVKEIFGDDFADLCLLIYIHGKIDLKTIISQTKQTFSYIKDLLLILIKHNFVEFTIPNPDNLPEPIANAEYKLSESTILNSLRFPIILDLINKLYSKNDKDCLIAKNIIELLMLETSLTVSDILLNFQENLELNESQNFRRLDESEILKVLLGLIKANFIMRANQYSKGFILKDELGGEEEQKDHINVKRKRKGKEKLTIKPSKKMKLHEDALNFLHEIPNELKILTESENLMKSDLKIMNKGDDQEKEELIDKTNPLFVDPLSHKEMLIQINFRQFIHEIRANIIVEMVEEKISPSAAFVIQSMLKASKFVSPAFEIKHTENLSVEQILKLLPYLMKIEPQALVAQLEVLKNDNGHFIVEKIITENFATIKKYAVNIGNIIKNLQIKTYEKVLSKIYSPNHVRIFRILMKFQNLDDKKISEFAMIPIGEARKYIHEMYKDNIFSTQDINDENDSKITIYFIKHKMVIEKIKENFIKTIYNLKIQKSKYEEKLNDPITNLDINGKEMLLGKIFKFESAILDVDSLLLIFSEF